MHNILVISNNSKAEDGSDVVSWLALHTVKDISAGGDTPDEAAKQLVRWLRKAGVEGTDVPSVDAKRMVNVKRIPTDEYGDPIGPETYTKEASDEDVYKAAASSVAAAFESAEPLKTSFPIPDGWQIRVVL